MRILRKPLLFLALGGLLTTQTGCFGSFGLTKTLYEWNDGVSSSKFVKTLVFWGMSIIPVYAVGVFLDVIIFNLIEFWSGSNPIAMEEGEHEMQLVTFKGEQYRIEATKDTFTTTQLSGDKAGEVRVMKFDRSDRTWKYSDSRVADQPVMTFLDDDADQVRVYTATGYADLATADLGDHDALAAKLAGCGAEAFACAD